MHEKEFSRKSFVKGGGALIVGFSVLGAGIGGKAQAAGDRPVRLEPARATRTSVDSWLDDPRRQHGQRSRSGQVELGPGHADGAADDRGRRADMDIEPDEA